MAFGVCTEKYCMGLQHRDTIDSQHYTLGKSNDG